MGLAAHEVSRKSLCSVLLQVLQELLWLAPNAFILGNPCAWFGKFVSICGVLRWSLWNFVSPPFAQFCCPV